MDFSPTVSTIVIDEIVGSGIKSVVNGGIVYSNSVDSNNVRAVLSDELPVHVNLDINEKTGRALNLTVSGTDASGASDITTVTAFAENTNITANSTVANPAQYQISKLNETITAPPADGVANYIISGNNNSINLSDLGIYSGTGTYRIDNISDRAIDAEKDDIDDINLCWAATAANMLYWSGWGTHTGSLTVSIEDDLLDYFANNFTDLSGNTYFAIEWFFDGIYLAQVYDDGWSKLNQSGGGGFYTTVTESDYHYVDPVASTVMTSTDQYLRNGNVCGLLIQWFSGGGHVVTCWGIEYDSSKSVTSKDYYTGVWISDSDDKKPLGRSAPDETRYCPIVWDSLNSSYTITYQIGEVGWLDQVDGLAKYSSTQDDQTLAAGERMTITAGNTANRTTISSGGTQTVFGTANITTINGSGSQIVSSGGIASSTTINANGYQYLYASGTANITTINLSGYQEVDLLGVANNTIVNANGTQRVLSGGTANAATVNAYGIQNIYTGGVANSTLVNSGAQYVSGGTANATTVSKGGQAIYSGGIASGAVINSGTWQGISSGGVANNTILNAGWQYLYTGGVASSTTVNSAGYQVISSGGLASGTVVNSGGQIISSGGTATTTIINAGGSQTVKGLANGATVNAGVQFVSSGGSASGTVVNLNGKMQIYSGGMANSTTLSGGIQNIYAGGVASVTNVNLSGRQIVYSGGAANSGTVNSGGSMFVSSGGVANSTTLAGGSQNIYAGGIANETNVNLNGRMYLFSGGIANGATINAYGLQHIYRGGVANSTLVNAGGQYVSSGGTANATTVSKGGQVIYSSGIAISAVINSGTWQGVFSGGVAKNTTLNAGWQYLYTGGVASATTVNSAGCQVVFSGATASSTTINSGVQIISSGGTASSTIINAGGSQTVKGLANGATVNAGVQFVSSGGTASGTLVNLNGKMQVYSGGRANSTTLSGGIQNIYSGGVASGTNVNLNGRQIVYSGGSTNSATVNSGGSMFVSSGGILSGSLTIDGGHVTVAYSNNMQTPTVNFKLAVAQANDAILVIQTGVTGDVSGSAFNLNIDNTATGSYILADGANLTSMSSVTFSVTDNGQNVNMQVGTSYTFADGDHLSLSFSDSTRDKLIAAFTNNPPAASRPIVFNPNAEISAASTFDNAKMVDSVQQTGWVSLAGNDDDYRFDLASPVAGGTLRLHDLTGGNADLSLYNASGTLLQSSNNTGTLEDSIISNLGAGTYFARVNAVSGNIDYKLDFDQKYVTVILAS